MFSKKPPPCETIPNQVREHMVLAPVCRKLRSAVDRSALDAAIETSSATGNDVTDVPSPSKLYFGDDWATQRRRKRPRRGEKTLLPGCLPEFVPNARQVRSY